MRWLIVAAVLAASLSGCVQSEQPNELPSEGAGTSGPGSSDPGTRPADGEGFAPQSHRDENSTADGLHLSGVLSDCEEGFCIAAMASNEGTSEYHISNICVSPWSESMTRDGESVQHREPMFTCLAFGTRPIENGETLYYNTTWDKSLWNDPNGMEPAPEGVYVWTVHFQAYKQADGGDSVELTISFPVVVGET